MYSIDLTTYNHRQKAITMDHKKTIANGEWLCIICTSQRLIKKTYPSVEGLQNPLLSAWNHVRWNLSKTCISKEPLDSCTTHSRIRCSPSTINLYDSIQHLELSNMLWQISCNEIIAYEKEGSVCIALKQTNGRS